MNSPAPKPTPELSTVAEFVMEEVADWDDEVKSTARFKAFSGQRSDWDPQFRFWRDLILKITHRFQILVISPVEVKRWFSRGVLVPLCLDHVLLEMYKAGDVVRLSDFSDPTSGRLAQLFKRVVRLAGSFTSSSAKYAADDRLVVVSTLKDKVEDVVQALSESHWTSSCIITLKKLRSLCGGGQAEAFMVFSYMSSCGKAKYLLVNKGEPTEGLKVSLSQATISNVTSLDYNMLQLVWTAEKLQQQLLVIDQRHETSKKSALASLREGNKKVALRHARALKLASQNREQLLELSNRVDEVLLAIADAESTKKVSEAIQIAGRVMKENHIDVDELRQCLEELNEHADTQKQLSDVFGSTTYPGVDGDLDNIEDELNELELEMEAEENCIHLPTVSYRPEEKETAKESSAVPLETADSLSEAMSGLRLEQRSETSRSKDESNAQLWVELA